MTESTNNPNTVTVKDEIFDDTQVSRAASRIVNLADGRRDFVVDTDAVDFDFMSTPVGEDKKGRRIDLWIDGETFPIAPIAHGQIAEKMGIPKRYYDRMMTEAPDLLRDNVRHWFQNTPKKNLVRVLDGNARAFLSNRYRPLDNDELMEAVLPGLTSADVQIKQFALTESRLYVRAVTKRLTAEVAKGDIVQAGIVISNSEVGMGALKIEPMVYRLVCLNGMIHAVALNKLHVGRAFGNGDDVYEIMKDDTKELNDAAFWNTVRDVVSHAMSEDIFQTHVKKLQAAADIKIVGDPSGVIELAGKRIVKNGFQEGEQKSILKHLSEGNDLSAWGYGNAVTRAAQDSSSFDRRIELERMGAKIVEIPARDWKTIGEQSLQSDN